MTNKQALTCSCGVTYFPAHKMHRPKRRIVIISLETLGKRKNNDERILILVLYWKKT
jgi:hypothetical protein